ncbi:MAG: helix-turn-helix domain-containing protein [Pseudomonadales bacterium]|nr:helix-turn-helix domain-containing protein [Candidatus Woesebacteria bacterium]MCB9801690.1 helix-turn-helix domain-containing protein [Pseudomonadales bacterium]
MKTKRIGELLLEERTKQHISLDALSERTHIKREYLEALENNQFEVLPAAAFVKGYIKTYASVFDFDPSPVLALLRRDFKESARGTLVPREFIKPVLKKRTINQTTLGALLVSIMLLLVAGYIGYRWFEFLQPPRLLLDQPEEYAFVGAEMVVEGSTDADAVVSVDGLPVELAPDATFETTVSFETEGTHLLPVVATDRRGKQTEVVRKVFVRF